jgi:hypothetical protein
VKTVAVVRQIGYGRASSSADDVVRTQNHLHVVQRNIFVCAAKNCIYHALQCVRCYKMQAFKTQSLQNVRLRYVFAKDTMERKYEDKGFLERLAFTVGLPSMFATWLRPGALNSLMRSAHKPGSRCLKQNTPVSVQLQCRQPAVLRE